MNSFNLNNLVMNAVETDSNGVINHETIFNFKQNDDRVYSDYSGGKIDKGYLVGLISGSELKFRFCQLEVDGTLNAGESVCELMYSENSLLQIVVSFKWESREGTGKNVIQEMK